MKLNNIVNTSNKYGIGKVVKVIDDNTFLIEYFINLSKKIIEETSYEKVTPLKLEKQTRVYNYSEELGWRRGRVIDYELFEDRPPEYEIQFANGVKEWYEEKNLNVRCLVPFGDPTEVLAFSYGETQFFNDSRRNIIDWFIKLRASSRGLTALTSSSIDLVVHQVNIVRKILSDPIQRYLLADEVGMGKTIEAGIIARQCLLDSNESKVLIIVPEHLIPKWENEMQERFYFNDFENRYRIISPDNINLVNFDPDLIIIDESHHLIANNIKYKESAISKIICMAQKSNKLLLLSATPGIGNEDVLLKLLKVLDPTLYKEESLESFKLKVTRQSEHGTFLRTLKSNQSIFLLKRNLPKISTLFPDDEFAEVIKSKILTIIDDESKKDEITLLIKQLRSHLIESWRIHNRLIRTRRIDTEGWEFQERGKKIDTMYTIDNLFVSEHPNKVFEDINQKIEEWRSYLSLKIEHDDKKFIVAKKRYITLLETSNMDFEVFEYLLKDCINKPIIDEEKELLNNILDSLSKYNYEENLKIISEKIKLFLNNLGNRSIGVIFISDTVLATKYLLLLQSIMGDEYVALFNRKYTEEMTSSQISKIRVIICDKDAEEGIDLQFADVIIHLDLPSNPSRIEQRIGRLDRYGRKKSLKIQHLIILPTNDSSYPWIAWYNLLLSGFKVFHEPISDIQLKLEAITIKLQSELFKNGNMGLENHFDINGNIDDNLIKYINTIIIEERDSLDEQYALNHLSSQENESFNIYEELDDSEYDEKGLEKDFNHWLFSVLKFYKFNITDKIFEVKWHKKTLIPVYKFYNKKDFKSTENIWEMESTLNRQLTYYRKDAVENKDVSLLRPGHPLFTTLQHYMELEDRGTAFTTFRVVDNKFPIFIPHNEIKIMFKLTFILEAGFVSDNSKDDAENYLYMRRTDDYLPPEIFTIYIDEKFNIIDDDEITDVLDEPYVKGEKIDTNLSNKHHIIDSFIDAEKLNILCKDVSEKSKDILFNCDEYITIYNDSIKKVKIDIDLNVRKIEQRRLIQEKINTLKYNAEYDRLISFEKSLLKGVESPNIKLDSFGMFFLSRFPLSEMNIDE